jgi:Formyl transferase
MRVLIVSAYPRVDRFAYKARILQGLTERGHDVRIVYSGIRVRDYFLEARRRGLLNASAVRRTRGWGTVREGSDDAGACPALPEFAARLGIEVGLVDSLGSDAARDFVERFNPDHGINLSGQYIPSAFIRLLKGRIVGGHYGDLPRFRGRDTVRWPILMHHPTVVSHMFLSERYDMGDILLKSPVEVTPGQNFADIWRACQERSADGHLKVVDASVSRRLEPRPQLESEGTTFYEMGAFLRKRVDDLLEDGAYRSPGTAS